MKEEKEEKNEDEQADEVDEAVDDGGDEPTGLCKLPASCHVLSNEGEEDEEVIFRADCKLWKLVKAPDGETKSEVRLLYIHYNYIKKNISYR